MRSSNIKIERNKTRGGYYEIQVVSKNQSPRSHWDKNSLFIEDEVFQLISSCFHNISGAVSQFGETKYETKQLSTVLKKLDALYDRIDKVKDVKSFVKTISDLNKHFKLDIDNSEKEWKNVINNVKELILELEREFQDAIIKNKNIYILGI